MNTAVEQPSDFELITEAIEDVELEPTSYSGRMMYGRQCLGTVCDDPHQAVARIITRLVINMLQLSADVDEAERVASLLHNSRTDNMGLGFILYWPEIDWEG